MLPSKFQIYMEPYFSRNSYFWSRPVDELGWEPFQDGSSFPTESWQAQLYEAQNESILG